MMMLLVCCLQVLALDALCFSMERHARGLTGRVIPAHVLRSTRLAGGGLLMLSVWPATAALGFSIGLSVWFGLLSVVAFVLGLLLAYRPAWLAWPLRLLIWLLPAPQPGGD